MSEDIELPSRAQISEMIEMLRDEHDTCLRWKPLVADWLERFAALSPPLELGGEGEASVAESTDAPAFGAAEDAQRKSEETTRYGKCRGCFVHEGERHLPDCPVMAANLATLDPDEAQP